MDRNFFIQGISEFQKHNPDEIINFCKKISEIYMHQCINTNIFDNLIEISQIFTAIFSSAILLQDLNIVTRIMSNISLVEESIKSIICKNSKFLEFTAVDKVKTFINTYKKNILNRKFIAIAVATFNEEFFYQSAT